MKIDDTLKKLGDTLKKAVKDYSNEGLKKTLDEAGKEVKDSIQQRWRDGQGVDAPGDDPSNLKSLTRNTVKIRRQLNDQGKLNTSLTDPAKSNLISSGETYNSLTFKATKKDLTFSVGNRGSILADNEERGRVMMNLSKQEIDIILEKVDKDLDDVINKALDGL